MSEEMKTAEWKGTKEEPIEVSAGKILDAIADKKSIKIEHAVIKGDLDISKIDDIDDRLERDEDDRLVIQESIKIKLSKICGNAYFRDVLFCSDVSFTKTTFCKKVSFDTATFSRDAYFSYTIFRNNVYFNNAIFGDNAFFSNASFFGKDTFFINSTFNREICFSDAKFMKDASFSNATFSSASFSNATFSEVAYFGNTKMKYPANFAGVNYEENTVRVGLKNYILCPFVSWLTRGKVKLSKRPETDFSKLNTETIMDGSSNPYLKRYIDDEQWIASWRSRSWWRKFLFVIWELTSHCGRSIRLWAFWSLLIAFFFGWVYMMHPCWFEQEMGTLSPWYFSIITFTTLGFGDLTPKAECWQGQAWVMAEVIIGYIMLGGLISIFANKFARRS